MRLGSFLLLATAAVLFSCVLVFWGLSEQAVGKAFDRVEVQAERNIIHAVKNRIETKKDYLASLGGMLRFNYDFTGLYVVARETGDRVLIFEEIQRIARQAKLDAFQLVSPEKQIDFSVGLGKADLPKDLFDPKETRTGVMDSENGPFVVSVTPLELYDAVVGYAVIGYQIERIREEVQTLYETPLTFQFSDPSPDVVAHRLPLSAGLDMFLSFPQTTSPAKNARRTLRMELIAAGLAAFMIALFAIYGLLEIALVRKFKSLLTSIDRATERLERDEVPEPPRVQSFVTDVGKVSDSFRRFSFTIREYRERYEEQARLSAETSKRAALSELAQQVAHDIRSPLSSIDMLVLGMDGITKERRAMLKSCVSRINGIAEKLLAQFRGDDIEECDPCSESLPALCREVIHEKELRHLRVPLQLEFSEAAEMHGFAQIQGDEFKTLLSNLIENAMEATTDSGEVRIGLEVNGDQLRVCVSDQGAGIPQDVLPKLGERGATFGKKGGSGLGLHHARTMLRRWGGNLSIESASEGPQRGTRVFLDLPRCEAPGWRSKGLVLEKDGILAIVDDDPAVHERWRSRLGDFAGLRLRHFMRTREVENWCEEEQDEARNAYYLCDMQIDEHLTGLELLEKIGARGRATLVTAVEPDAEIRDNLRQLDIHFLPKREISSVTIKWSTPPNSDA